MGLKLVLTLKFKIDKHPSPYKMGKIKKGGEVLVNEICMVPLSIGGHYRPNKSFVTC